VQDNAKNDWYPETRPPLNIVMMATLHIALAIQASRSPLELALIVGFVDV